jgi:hypothetical protein
VPLAKLRDGIAHNKFTVELIIALAICGCNYVRILVFLAVSTDDSAGEREVFRATLDEAKDITTRRPPLLAMITLCPVHPL